jgi:hypothetical protein
MNKYCLLLYLLFSFQLQALVDPLPFTTDLCTGYPEGTKEEPMAWAHCCLKHDLDLWAGGDIRQRSARDLALKDCVTQTGHPDHARVMWIGVSLGRLSPIKIPGQQWGNAWGSVVRKNALSIHEIISLKQSLQQSSLSLDTIEAFIHELMQRNP